MRLSDRLLQQVYRRGEVAEGIDESQSAQLYRVH